MDDNLVTYGLNSDAKLKAQVALLDHLGVDLQTYRERVVAGRSILMGKTDEQLAKETPGSVLAAVKEITAKTEDFVKIMGLPEGSLNEADYILNNIVPKSLEKLMPSFDRTKRAEYIAKTTNKKVLRTSKTRGEGIALDENRLDTYKMSDIFSAANKEVSDNIEKIYGAPIGKAIGGEKLANLKARYTIAAMRAIDAGLRSRGIPAYVS